MFTHLICTNSTGAAHISDEILSSQMTQSTKGLEKKCLHYLAEGKMRRWSSRHLFRRTFTIGVPPLKKACHIIWDQTSDGGEIWSRISKDLSIWGERYGMRWLRNLDPRAFRALKVHVSRSQSKLGHHFKQYSIQIVIH